MDEGDCDLIQDLGQKKLLYSQKGCLTGIVRTKDLESAERVDLNVTSWKSKTNRRIVESSFAAETHGALLGYSCGHFQRVLLLEIYHGEMAVRQDDLSDWYKQMPLVMATDCKSVFDCISRDNQSIGDKSNSINVAILRQLCSTEKFPFGSRAKLLWVPTRHQLADPLTKFGQHMDMQNSVNSAGCVFHGRSAKEILESKRISTSVKAC